jgi:hypothetical protein
MCFSLLAPDGADVELLERSEFCVRADRGEVDDPGLDEIDV